MTKTKKILIGLACVVGGLILLFVGHAVYVMFTTNGPALDVESKAWVNEVTPKIIKSWDANELRTVASPEFLQNAPGQELEKFTTAMHEQLGDLVKYDDAQGEAGIHVNNFSTTITAEYFIEADFSKGHARVFVLGIKKDNKWELSTIYVTKDPNVRWWNGQLTDQSPLKNPGDSQDINGTHVVRLLNNK